MDMLTLIDELGPDTLDPVYIFYYSEERERYLIDSAFARIKQVALQGPMSDFNLIQLNAKDVSGKEIVAEGMQIPMLASKRVLLVENGEKLSMDDLNDLDPYFAEPPSTACLVIIAEKLNVNRGPLARAKKRGQLYKAEPIKQRGAGQYIRTRARERGVDMDPAAVAALANAVGTNCAALDDAVERLGLYAGQGASVTADDVADVVTTVREHSIFELVDAIGTGQSSKTLALLENLLARQEEPLRINAMVARQVRLLLRARVHIHEGANSFDLPRLLGVPGFVATKLHDQAQRLRGAKLEQFLLRLADADLELKSSRRPPRLVVEQAVIDLCLGN